MNLFDRLFGTGTDEDEDCDHDWSEWEERHNDVWGSVTRNWVDGGEQTIRLPDGTRRANLSKLWRDGNEKPPAASPVSRNLAHGRNRSGGRQMSTTHPKRHRDCPDCGRTVHLVKPRSVECMACGRSRQEATDG